MTSDQKLVARFKTDCQMYIVACAQRSARVGMLRKSGQRVNKATMVSADDQEQSAFADCMETASKILKTFRRKPIMKRRGKQDEPNPHSPGKRAF